MVDRAVIGFTEGFKVLDKLPLSGLGLGIGTAGGARFRQHLVGHVDADDPAATADLVRRHEGVEAAARSDVDDPLSLRQRAQRKRIGDAGKGIDRRVGQRRHECVVVAEMRGEIAPGMKVMRAMRIERQEGHKAIPFEEYLRKRGVRVER